MFAMKSVMIREIRVPFAMMRRSEAFEPEANQNAGAPGVESPIAPRRAGRAHHTLPAFSEPEPRQEPELTGGGRC